MKNVRERATLSCRAARRQFGALADREFARSGVEKFSDTEQAEANHHIETCSHCAEEYRLVLLSRTALRLAASPKPVRPDEDFFKALRARIERGPQVGQPQPASDESWAAALFLTGRQLIPVMAVLLLIIIGATILWNSSPQKNRQIVVTEFRPRDRVVFNDIYEFPEPTRDDVLETLVAVEEKKNDK